MRDGESQNKCTAHSIHIVPRRNLATMRVDDPVANAQTQPSSLADLFCCEEWIKNALGMCDSRTVILEKDLQMPVAARRRNFNSSGTLDLSHRIIGVVEDVQENLLQLVRIADDERQILFEVFRKFHTVIRQIVGP